MQQPDDEVHMISALEREERNARLSCRFYEAEFPELEECVLVQVNSIAEMGAYVSLLEYNNIEGMILLSELSRRRIRSINKLIRVGKVEVAMVIRVDKEKGYIDLSKRRVGKEDFVKAEERYSRGKAVNSIMRHLAETTNSNLLDLNKQIAWPLARPPYQNTHQAFRMAITDPEKVFGPLNVDPDVLAQLMTVIRRKLTPQPIKIRADVEVICYQPEGIDAIIAALREGEKVGMEDPAQASDEAQPLEAEENDDKQEEDDGKKKAKKRIRIKLIAPPRYVMLTTALNKAEGLALLERAIEAVREVITSRKGNLNVSAAPHVTSSEEEHALKALMEQMENENREVEGDSDGDDDGSGED